MNNEDNSKSNTNDLPNNISDSNNPVKKDENEANSQLNKSKTVTSDENTGGDSKSRDITGLEYDESRSERIMARRLRIENNKNNNLKPKNMNNVLIKNKNDTNDVTGKSKQQTQKSRKYIESTKWKDSEMVTNIRVNILTR
jgi:hypothetical protein